MHWENSRLHYPLRLEGNIKYQYSTVATFRGIRIVGANQKTATKDSTTPVINWTFKSFRLAGWWEHDTNEQNRQPMNSLKQLKY